MHRAGAEEQLLASRNYPAQQLLDPVHLSLLAFLFLLSSEMALSPVFHLSSSWTNL